MLDDVVTSFDSSHRLRLLRVLKEELGDWQFVILTHEPTWFELIKKEFAPEGWLFKEFETSSDPGLQIRKSPKDFKEEIIQSKVKGILSFNDLRRLLERVLKEICLHLEVKVAFRYNRDNERRMSGELLSQLRSTLKKKSPPTVKNPIFARLETSNLITTAGSHNSSLTLNSGELNTAYDDLFELDQLFCCPQCRCYVSDEKYVDHEGKVYCKCGKKHLDWQA